MAVTFLFFGILVIIGVSSANRFDYSGRSNWQDTPWNQNNLPPYFYGQIPPPPDPRIWYEYALRRQNQQIRFLRIVLVLAVIALLLMKYL